MKADKGFTLLEVLIAITLFGLMLGLVFSTLHMAARAWEAGEPRASALSGRMVVERFFRNQLASAQSWSGDRDRMPIEGNSDSISFTAFLPFQAGLRGPQRMTVALKDDVLEVQVTPVWREMSSAGSGTPPLVLLDHVQAVQFRYYSDESWHDSWEKKDLPGLVSISLETQGGVVWPPLTIALRHGKGQSGASFGSVPVDFR